MGKIFRQFAIIFSFLMLFLIGGDMPQASAQYENANISYNNFYEDLAPYGQWIEDPNFGYVWSPSVDGSFRPYYTNGHWAMTDYGNTWVSDYSWGWACFHYGRWTYDSYYGWLWIPGSNWGPAWVSWRYGEGYYGWAPLGPGYDFTAAAGEYSCPSDWWVFIPPQYLYSGSYYHYWYGPRGNSAIIGHTGFVNNTYVNNSITYVSGPRGKDVENITHQPVTMFHLKNAATNRNTRVHDNEIKMFRPAEIRPAAAASGQRPMPPNVVTAPQPVRTPQAVNTGQATPPQFRNNIPAANVRTETPGANINQTAVPVKPTPRYDNNPYEWDVNKAQPQPQRNTENAAPENRQQYQPRSQPAAQPQPRQAPAPQPRTAPEPRTVPAPQQQPRPVQNPPREGGRK